MKNFITVFSPLALVVALTIPKIAIAADFFVRDAIPENGVAIEDARATTNLVKNAVVARSTDRVLQIETPDAYILQPHLMKLGDSWILTVEKLRGSETLFAAQSKTTRLDQLDSAARSATFAAIDEPSPRTQVATGAAVPYQVPPIQNQPPIQVQPAVNQPAPYANQGGTTAGRTIDVLPANRKVSYWSIGVGPFFPHRLQNNTVMYDIAAGHAWDINPRAGVKVTAEGNFSSGAQTGTFLNFSTGANYYVRTLGYDTAPYFTGDMGYGFARSAEQQTAEGFSLGVGAGFEFFRTTETTLDLLFRYNIILNTIAGEGYPSVLGARLAVNF